MPTCSFLALILVSVLLTSQTCSLLSDISLGELYSYILNIPSVFFFPFFFSLYSYSVHIFYSYSTGHLFLLLSFVHFFFSSGSSNCDIFKLRVSFIHCDQSTNKHIKDILQFYYSVSYLQHLFLGLLQDVHLFAYIVISYCMLFTLLFRVLSMLIIVVLNFHPSFNISVMSGSDVCTVSSNCCFGTQVYFATFFLKI